MSSIDPTKPVYGSPTTQSVRDNFNFAKTEIDGLTAAAATKAQLAAYLPLAGGILTGLLTLSAVPTANLHAATKGYVDAAIAQAATATGASFLPLGGGTLTGGLNVGTNTSAAQLALNGPAGARRRMVLQTAGAIRGGLQLSADAESGSSAGSILQLFVDGDGGAETTVLSFSRATGEGTFAKAVTLATGPTLATHAATKGYVDTTISGAVGLTEAPQDGTAYVRKNAGWLKGLALADGGTVTGPTIFANGSAQPVAITAGPQWTSSNLACLLNLKASGRNPALGLSDTTGTNYVALANASGGLQILSAPDPGNTSGAPALMFSVARNGNITATGDLTLARPPTATLHAATKGYVDGAAFLPLAGGTLTGGLTVGGTGIRYGGAGNAIAFTWAGGLVSASVDGTGTPGGLLPTSGGTITGSLMVNGQVNVAGVDFAMFRSSGYRYLQWAANWFDDFNESNGTRRWIGNPGVQLMSLNGGGDLTALTVAGTNGLFGSQIVINTNGAWKPGGGPWFDNSDARLKKNVVDYQSGLEAVCGLRPVRYQFNGLGGTVDDGRIYTGLIAQEAQLGMPELVIPAASFGDAPRMENQLALDSGPLLYALVNAVRTLRDRVALLEAA